MGLLGILRRRVARKTTIRIFVLATWVSVLTVVLVSFQNCSDARLVRYMKMGSAFAETASILPPPEKNDHLIRVMVFVDQSYSMIHGKCPTDLDGPASDLKGDGCANPEMGIDPQAHRYAVIDAWINEIASKPNVKVSLIPFSGGIKSRPLQDPLLSGEGISDFKFKDIPSTRLRFTRLLNEHMSDVAKATTDAPDYMGTTVPLPTLKNAKDILYQEMRDLQKQGLLYKTDFRFIYMSDGVFKPLDAHLTKALTLAKCASQTGGGACGALTQNFYYFFGDPKDNDFQKIVDTATFMAGYSNYFSEGTIKMDFVKVHPERISVDDVDAPNQNIKSIFDKVSTDIPKSTLSTIVDGTPPFKIVSGFASNLSYKLKSLYVVNLNAFVDRYGGIIADSDGDGIPDNEELLDGTDPTDPRTPDPTDGNRYCMDSIKKKYGCKKAACISTFDSDGDGLNECEEGTAGTDPRKKDTDKDTIIDYFEITRGLSPLVDDRTNDINSDGVTNATSFAAGVHPMADFGSVPLDNRIQYSVNFEKWVPTVDGNGTPAQVGSYSIKVDNIPLVATMATSVGSDLYYSKTANSNSKIDSNHLVGPTPHGANVNEILFLAQVQAVQDPNLSYWLLLRKQVSVPYNTGKVKLEVNFTEFSQLKGTGD